MMYMCITAFGMLNGLTGIFGDAFARNIKRREQLAAELAAKEAAAAGAPAPLTEREFNVILMEIKGTLISQGNRMQALSKRISLE